MFTTEEIFDALFDRAAGGEASDLFGALAKKENRSELHKKLCGRRFSLLFLEFPLAGAAGFDLHVIHDGADIRRGVPFPGFAKAKVYGDLRTLFKKSRRLWQREIFPTETEDGENPLDAEPDPRDEAARIESDDAFRAMLAPLGEKPRRLLALLYQEGLTQKEAAARLGMSQQAAAVIKGRALKTLRKQAASA